MNAKQVRTEILRQVNAAADRTKVEEFTLQIFLEGVHMSAFDFTGVAGDVIRAAEAFESAPINPTFELA